MTDIRIAQPQKYNLALAEALKEFDEIQKPEWVDFVKTSTNRQRPTLDDNFWHKRAASILRQVYVKNVVGVQRLRTRYGGRKDRGMQPPEFRKGGGKIIRLLLQQMEAAGLLEKSKDKKAGRKLTDKGRKFLEKVSGGMK